MKWKLESRRDNNGKWRKRIKEEKLVLENGVGNGKEKRKSIERKSMGRKKKIGRECLGGKKRIMKRGKSIVKERG